jgi:hypothetical protein
MGLFANMRKAGGRGAPQPAPPQRPAEPLLLLERSEECREGAEVRDPGNSSGRTALYAVRVRDGFKREVLSLQAEVQLERQRSKGKARKVTEGEIMELMLDALKAFRRNSGAAGHAVPVANDVWLGIHELARRLQRTPAEVFEELVVEKVAALGLVPRR